MTNTAATVVKHDISSLQQKALGTETLVHHESGSTRLGMAIRFNLGVDTDRFQLQVKMRVPGSSSVDTDDDYYLDQSVTNYTLGGTASGASFTFASGTPKQHVFSIGPYYAVPAEWVVVYTWTANTASSSFLDITTWTMPQS